MDNWTDKQITLMKTGGNQECNDFLKKHGVDIEKTTIREKYDTPAAELYKEVLLARVEGRPEPTELPKKKNPLSNSTKKKKMEGFGSSAPPPAEERPKKKRLRYLLMVAVPAVIVIAVGVVLLLLFL
jgi:hypothetical protein